MDRTPFLLLSAYSFLRFLKLCERRVKVIVLADVAIKNPAIVFCHVERTVSHQLLEHERISTAVQEILTGEGMPEFMDRGAFDTSVFVVSCDCVA